MSHRFVSLVPRYSQTVKYLHISTIPGIYKPSTFTMDFNKHLQCINTVGLLINTVGLLINTVGLLINTIGLLKTRQS